MYDIYLPTIKDIEVLKLEKRLDNEMYYLLDGDPKRLGLTTRAINKACARYI